MKHGSLFSGIGGFDLAAEWMGWSNMFHCEYDDFNRRVLKYYWPNAEAYRDIRETDFSIWGGRINILTGGFPCQPFSSAGRRLGDADERHLWPEMLRAIREIRPRWIVAENVYALINWSGGMVFEEVCVDMEDEGYEVQAFIIPAAGVDAPHKRDRVWFVAYAKQEGLEGVYEARHTGNGNGFAEIWGAVAGFGKANNYEQFPAQSFVCGGDDGIPSELVGITVPAWRKRSLMAYGNAIVPQVAQQIFRAIEKFELL